MHADVVEQPLVCRGLGRLDIESGGLQKISAPAPKRDLLERVIGLDRHIGHELAHVRLDGRRAEGARDRNAMMAVEHEVRVADLVQLDDRKAGHPHGERADVFPSLAKRVFAREEEAIEIAVAPEGADDAVERDFTDTAIDRVPQSQRLADRLERKKIARLAAKLANQIGHQSIAAGLVEAGHRDNSPLEYRPMRSLRPLAAAAVLLLLSCSTSSRAYAGKQRAVGRTTPVVQWQHDWAGGAVFYEIFVRSFSDSDRDGIGDINGLIEKLDYLNDGNPATTTDLGIEGIWLMPVFESPSYHGYDTVDYEAIERDYGTNADFARLLEEAHRRGIRVIVDFVVNHTSNQHPWFVDAASSTSSPKRNWYVWSPVQQGWTQPWGGNSPTWHSANGAYYYGVFWSGMPDVNWTNPESKAEMFRIARHWLQQGVDGYRLDATRYLVETGGGPGQADTPQTHAALKELGEVVRRTKPEAILVAENWTTAPIIATYYGSTEVIKGGDEMPMNFNFPLADAILRGVSAGTASGIAGTIEQMQSLYPAGVLDAPFLTNHDQRRVGSELSNNAAKLRNAAAILLTLPGVPFLYYGEEVGMQNGPTSGDESKRTPMPWTPQGGFTAGTPWFPYAPGIATTNVASQTGDPGSLLSRYRTLIAMRKSSPALRKGTLQLLPGSSQVLVFLRRDPSETVLVAHNVSDSFATASSLSFQASRFETIFGDASVTPAGAAGSFSVSLPPRASMVWRVVP